MQQRPEGTIPLGRRALILGIILVPLLCIAVQYGELIAWVGEVVAASLMLIVVSVLCSLLAANYLLKRWKPAWRLARAELLYLFVMLTVAGSIAGVGMMQFVVPLLGHLLHYATPTNHWEQFEPYIPQWFIPEEAVLPGFYEGQTTFYALDHIRGWLTPIVVWSAFVFAFISFMLCLNLLLRRQWIEKERLAFPIVYFPLELTREGSSIWRERLLWIGFVIPMVLQSLASLNFLYPAVPYIPLKPSPQLNIGRFLAKGPLDPLANVTLAFYPMALGIAYFAQSDVLFSCWFFYWIARLEEILSTVLGFRGPMSSSDMPYLNQQSLGAFVALGAVALWLGRADIVGAVKRVFRRSKAGEDDTLSQTAALGGLLVSGLFLVFFCLKAGIPLHIVALFFTIYFLVVIGFSRIRAHAGLPWAFGPNHPPHIFMIWAVGPANISAQALTSLTYLQWFDWDYRCVAMPHQMEALKISSSAGLRRRDMIKGILISSVLAIVVSYVAVLAIYYHYGAESGKVEDYRTNWASMPIDLLVTWGESQARIGWAEIAGGVVGTGSVVVLSALHTRWLWWPFHPVGYALSCTFTLQWLWFPLFLVWVCKTLILRYGGIKLYRRGIPFAVGLILGDYLVSTLWGLIGLATGQQMYSIFWN